MLKLIRDFVADQITVSDNPLTDWLLIGIIGTVSGAIAYHIVGRGYENGLFDGRIMGKIAYCVAWIFIFLILSAVAAGIIWVGTAVGGLFT